MKKAFFIILTAVALWQLFTRPGETILGPGVFAPEAPWQKETKAPRFEFQDYTVTPLADFQIKAKVLSRENYHFGREAKLVPIDLAFGWGRMSDETVLAEIDFSQSNRWFHWRTDSFPIPRKEIETYSANMHLIAADGSVASIIEQTRKGDIVELTGRLVRVDASDGWHWSSSLQRDDTGSGACELIWVEQYVIERL